LLKSGTKAAAMDAAEFIKSRGAQSEVVVKDLKTGEVTTPLFKVN
jgi:hypothetical protein